MAGRETKTVDIGEHKYSITKFGGIEGTKWYGKFARMGVASRGEGPEADPALFMALMIEEPGFLEACAKATRVLYPSGKTPVLWDVYDAHFTEFEDVAAWLGQVISLNFNKRKGGLTALENTPADPNEP